MLNVLMLREAVVSFIIDIGGFNAQGGLCVINEVLHTITNQFCPFIVLLSLNPMINGINDFQ
jgi:hypothetical protein